MMGKQKILYGLLTVLLLLCLTGCTHWTANTQNLDWHQQMAPLLHQNSYTVHVQMSKQGEASPYKETTAFFDGVSSHMIVAEAGEEPQEIYYARTDGKCWIYGWDEEHSIWIRQEIDDSDNYFYAYSVMERLQKLGAWIDLDEIRYDRNKQIYTGENLSGTYACEGQTHRVLSVEISLENNKVHSFTELYATMENEKEQLYADTVWFEDIGLTQIDLPVNCISAEEIAAFAPADMPE